MNPLALPVGIAIRVMGDLTAVAAAARAFVELDTQQMQADLHELAQTAAALPRIEQELTARVDEAEETAERAVRAVEALLATMPDVLEGAAELGAVREAAQAIVDALPVLQGGVAEVTRAADAGEKLVEGIEEVRASREVLLRASGQAEQLIATSARAQQSLDRASDNVEVALARVEPLQGLTERIARLNERLPGGRTDRGG